MADEKAGEKRVPQKADFHDRDFEDDIQLQSAIQAGCSHLFTRDPTHFRSTAIAVVPPSSFTL